MTDPEPAQAPPPQASLRLHLGFLDGLRGLAALYVVLEHAANLLVFHGVQIPHWGSLMLKPLGFGHYAVAVFIVLSGFCLMLPVALSADKKLRGGWREYFLRRGRRILPPYYAALAFSLLLTPWTMRAKQASGLSWTDADHITAGNVLTHLLLVHNWSNVYIRSIDGPLWSVATEWQIYFFLPFVLLPLWRRGGLAVTVAAAFAIGLAPHFLCPPQSNLDEACPWYLGLFALGMTGAVVSGGRDPRLQMLTQRVPWGVLTAVSAVAVAAGRLRNPGAVSDAANWYMDILCGLFSVCLIVWCSRRAQGRKFWLTDALQSPPAMALGAMSYSVYLMHTPVEQGLIWMLWSRHLPFGLLLAATFSLVVPAAIGVCYLFHLAFERPFMPGRPRNERAAEKAALLSPAP